MFTNSCDEYLLGKWKKCVNQNKKKPFKYPIKEVHWKKSQISDPQKYPIEEIN